MNNKIVTTAVPSPCIDVCTLDERDVCIGCGRTLDEIICWSSSDDKTRREIVARAGARKVKRPFTDR